MKKKVLKITISLGIIFLFLGLSVIMVNAQYVKIKEEELKNQFKGSETLDMLIFISPQYNLDSEVNTAINTYINALKQDISWDTKIIKIFEENNNYETIDIIIEKYYEKYKIKSCLMVGEDLDTPLAGDTDYMEKPSIIPWSTLGLTSSYEKSSQGIISSIYKMDICVSFLYPTSQDEYNTKKYNIISAFEKFSKNRNKEFFDEITVFESKDINSYSKNIYENINAYANLYYKENPDYSDLEESLKKHNSIYFIHGHSNPSGTTVNSHKKIWFSADEIENINAPFFGADGCYVSGWWSNKPDNNKLDSSINGIWYGSKVLTGKNVKVMVLGLLSQNGYEDSVSFVENVLPNLTSGKTLAESMIGSYFTGDFTIYGDPSFYFTV